jgi:hypothetical protein
MTDVNRHITYGITRTDVLDAISDHSSLELFKVIAVNGGLNNLIKKLLLPGSSIIPKLPSLFV